MFAVLPLLVAGCAGSRASTSESQPPSTTRVSRSGDETSVTVQEAEAEPLNPVCIAYCDRVAECWHARPNNADLMLTKEDIVKRCKGEQAGCHTPTTDMLCCSELADCYDFNRCVTEARDTVTTCERVRGAAWRP